MSNLEFNDNHRKFIACVLSMVYCKSAFRSSSILQNSSFKSTQLSKARIIEIHLVTLLPYPSKRKSRLVTHGWTLFQVQGYD